MNAEAAAPPPPDMSFTGGHDIKHSRANSFAVLLRGAGLRVTRPRLRVLEILDAAKEPLDIETVVGRGHPLKLDYSTVFRTFQHLEKIGIVRRVRLGRPTTYFELACVEGHHDHITCNLCGRVSPIPGECPVEAYEKTLMEKTGFVRVSHSLEFFGLCPSCAGRAVPKQ